ncbi:hypothetical protein N7478_013292 [Penicillium angulare]|uniref:uncharacterized protein n=1 Tax=Penicillium angulare TaxID=116970 RepID=UPI002541D59E|nr:uncharacterized protein N7478_013292 [Penicillium angulare]KAJ5257188.1 hypothetical protein N7478_013292 [Penicillium angulare]
MLRAYYKNALVWKYILPNLVDDDVFHFMLQWPALKKAPTGRDGAYYTKDPLDFVTLYFKQKKPQAT